MKKRALVTGGAGFIGSHISDTLLNNGWTVRILDNLEPQTHKFGKPAWISNHCEFVHGDIRDRNVLTESLQDIDVVFHEAAYGGYMPEIEKFVDVNSLGTARMLEIIRDENIPIKKIVVASSLVVYSEGSGNCKTHGKVYPKTRLPEALKKGDFSVKCPFCTNTISSIPIAEDAPLDPVSVYAITKFDQEKLVLNWGKQYGVPTVALRYTCAYGPRQSIFNPYTGVVAIFCTRLLNDLPPVVYEDGLLTRDMCYVEDIANANLLYATIDTHDGQAINVGTGRALTILDIAYTVMDVLGMQKEIQIPGEFRPGEIRHMIPDITKISEVGFTANVSFEEGVRRYIAWIKTQGDIKEYFSDIQKVLEKRKIIYRVDQTK